VDLKSKNPGCLRSKILNTIILVLTQMEGIKGTRLPRLIAEKTLKEI